MTIAISISSILDGVYAISAMKNTVETDTPRPTLLNRRHAPALRRIARDIYAEAVIKLAPYISDTNLLECAENNTDILRTEIIHTDISPDKQAALPPILRVRLEGAVTAGILSVIWNNIDSTRAKSFDVISESCINDFKTTLRHAVMPKDLYIHPSY